MVVTLQDMSELEELNRLRAEFLAMVSHELRTPLATVKGSVATLIDPPAPLSPSEMKQFHHIIDTQINRMHVLISDLLDVARIETGTLAISPEPTDVAVLVGEARNSFRSTGNGHIIEIDVPQDLPWIMADRLRMLQLLGNLLNNAAKNSSPSSSHTGERRAGRRSTWRCRSPTRAEASPPTASPCCSRSSPASSRKSRGATQAWASPSARG